MMVERADPPLAAQEGQMLEAWRDFHRDTLAVKCEGLADAFETWRSECAGARERVAAAPSLDITGTQDGREFSLPWILVRMIGEYARHNGHADLLRQRIDGAVGV